MFSCSNELKDTHANQPDDHQRNNRGWNSHGNQWSHLASVGRWIGEITDVGEHDSHTIDPHTQLRQSNQISNGLGERISFVISRSSEAEGKLNNATKNASNGKGIDKPKVSLAREVLVQVMV